MKRLLLLITICISSVSFGQGFTNHITLSGIESLNTRAHTVIDYNNDGFQDLITVPYGGPNDNVHKLWRNNGDSTFTDVSSQVNYPQGNLGYNGYIYICNINNDYYSDLMSIDYVNDSVSFAINDGTQFNVETFAFNIDVHTVLDFGDYNGDGRIDIYAQVIFADNTRGISVFLNNYQKCTEQFSERIDLITGQASNVTTGGANFIDLDQDGDQDLVYCEQTGNQWSLYPTKLYRNDNGVFVDVSATSGLGSNMNREWTTWDYDKDGDLDLVLGTSDQAGAVCRVYRNDVNFSFTNVTPSVVLQSGSHYIMPTIIDFDNDFDQDVYHNLTSISNHTAQFYRNDGGTFVSAAGTYNLNINVGPNIGQAPPAGNPCWFDLENDGDLDVFVGDGNNTVPDNAHLMVNPLDTTVNRFLRIDLIGCQSPRLPFGAQVKLKVGSEYWIQEQDYIGIFQSVVNPRIHFGVGNVQTVDSIYVYWPSGVITTLANVQSNQILTIEENPGCYDPVIRQTPEPFSIGPDTLSQCSAAFSLDVGSNPAFASYLWNTAEDYPNHFCFRSWFIHRRSNRHHWMYWV